MTTVTLPESTARASLFWSATDDCFFNAKTISAALDVAEQTLANWRVSGDGPKFVKKGRVLYYRKADVMDWLKGLGQPVASTSELQAG